MALVVTLIGGESTGKSTLAATLAGELDRQGISTHTVSEHLRHWCERMGRAPLQHEQAAIAEVQASQIDAAARLPGVQVVVADTAPLVIAAYSELYFSDRTVWPAALDWQRHGAGLTLLMGLDLPWQPDGLFRESSQVRDAVDMLLRQALQSDGLPFQTVYGQGSERCQHALRAIGPLLGQPLAQQQTEPQQQRTWACEKCSDPDCEHRLFRRLLAPKH